MLDSKKTTPEHLEAIETLEANLAKAHALTAMTCGEAGPVFRNMSADLQENYLWEVYELVRQAREAINTLACPASA